MDSDGGARAAVAGLAGIGVAGWGLFALDVASLCVGVLVAIAAAAVVWRS